MEDRDQGPCDVKGPRKRMGLGGQEVVLEQWQRSGHFLEGIGLGRMLAHDDS